MRKLLISLLAAISLPTAVNAEVDPKVAEMCMKAVDFQGCVNAMTGKKEGKRLIMDQGVSLSEGNACQAGYAYIGGGTCQIVECYGSGLFLTIGGANDPILKKYGWRDSCPRSYPLVTYGDATTRAFNDPDCPSKEPGVGFNSTCHERDFSLKEINKPKKEIKSGIVNINCDSPVWKNKPRCN